MRRAAIAAALLTALLAACVSAADRATDECASPLLQRMRRARSVDVPPLPLLVTLDGTWRELCFGTVVAVDGPMVAITLENPAAAPRERLWCVLRVSSPDGDGILGDAVVVATHHGLLVCRYFDSPHDDAVVRSGCEAWIDEPTTAVYARMRNGEPDPWQERTAGRTPPPR